MVSWIVEDQEKIHRTKILFSAQPTQPVLMDKPPVETQPVSGQSFIVTERLTVQITLTKDLFVICWTVKVSTVAPSVE